MIGVIGVLGVIGVIGAALALGGLVWRRVRRVVVEGESMAPTLQPGDRLLVLRPARWSVPRPGDVVSVADPRSPGRLMVKRVRAVDAGAGTVEVEGDNAGASTDSRVFGPLARRSIEGVVRYRYAPPGRSGPIPRGPRAGRST